MVFPMTKKVRVMLSSNAFLEEMKNFQWLFDNIESASKYIAGKDRI